MPFIFNLLVKYKDIKLLTSFRNTLYIAPNVLNIQIRHKYKTYRHKVLLLRLSFETKNNSLHMPFLNELANGKLIVNYS